MSVSPTITHLSTQYNKKNDVLIIRGAPVEYQSNPRYLKFFEILKLHLALT